MTTNKVTIAPKKNPTLFEIYLADRVGGVLNTCCFNKKSKKIIF